MTICYARPERYEPTTIRCAVCKLTWDIDDQNLPPCPRLSIVPALPIKSERLPFKSGLR